MTRTIVVALALAGCAPVERADGGWAEDALPVERSTGVVCSVPDASRYVGRVATPALAGGAQAASGAALVRWLQPGTIVTMEYRADRLNIYLDAANKVVRLSCG